MTSGQAKRRAVSTSGRSFRHIAMMSSWPFGRSIHYSTFPLSSGGVISCIGQAWLDPQSTAVNRDSINRPVSVIKYNTEKWTSFSSRDTDDRLPCVNRTKTVQLQIYSMRTKLMLFSISYNAITQLHCESEKTRHSTHVDNFVKYWSIFKIISLLD